MRLLVAGGSQVDAGKTTFSVGLCHRLDAPGYKPRAGNDYWYDHDDYRRAVSEGRLYGKDARRLHEHSPDRGIEHLNPVHRLWVPSPGPRTGILGRGDREFVCDRVGGGDEPPTLVVNGDIDLPPSLGEGFDLDDAVVVDGIESLNAAMERYHLPALVAAGERIDAADRAVVESYADIARPLRGFEPDAVAVVEPLRVRVYGGRRYARACQVASGSAHEGQLEERTGAVVDLLDPQATVTLPALTSAERADPGRVAERYAPAYEALVAAAEEN